MDDLVGVLPHERRNFVHKRIGRGLKSFVTSGFNPLAAAGSFLAGDPRAEMATMPVVRPPPRRSSFISRAVSRTATARTLTARPSAVGAVEVRRGQALKFAGPAVSAAGCRPGTFRVGSRCVNPLAAAPGGDPLFSPVPEAGVDAGVGGAVMGRFGAALQPGSRIIDRAVCLPGMILGRDDLCYNKGQIKNSERMWPRGRRPLLTGGDMRAISIAARAASRLTRTAVRLQEIGLIKKPVARKPRKKKA